MATRKKVFSAGKEVKAIARERVGAVKPARAIEEKPRRDKPKHKKPIETEGEPE